LRVLLDEMLPVGVADLLLDHDVSTVKVAGFTGLAEIAPRAAEIQEAVR